MKFKSYSSILMIAFVAVGLVLGVFIGRKSKAPINGLANDLEYGDYTSKANSFLRYRLPKKIRISTCIIAPCLQQDFFSRDYGLFIDEGGPNLNNYEYLDTQLYTDKFYPTRAEYDEMMKVYVVKLKSAGFEVMEVGGKIDYHASFRPMPYPVLHLSLSCVKVKGTMMVVATAVLHEPAEATHSDITPISINYVAMRPESESKGFLRHSMDAVMNLFITKAIIFK